MKDDKSVSPVTGLILMVMLVVLLASTFFILSNINIQPTPNAVLKVELMTVNRANATKIVVENLGGDVINLKQNKFTVSLNGHKFNFYPFTRNGYLKAGDEGVAVVPFKTKIGQLVNVKIAIRSGNVFSHEITNIIYSKRVRVQKSKVPAVEKGLLAEWHFEGFNLTWVTSSPSNKREVFDLSGNGNDLDIAGWNDINTAWVKGINGMAYRFWNTGLGLLYLFSYYDGKDHPIDPGNDFTYEAWVKWEGETGWGNTIIYVGNYTYGYKVWLFVGSSTSNSANLGYYVTTTSGSVGGYTGYMLKNDTWYYIALTCDGKTVKLYVNGKLINSLTLPGKVVKSDYVTAIGGAPGYGSFGGVIDEVYVWKRALTPKEIIEKYRMFNQ